MKKLIALHILLISVCCLPGLAQWKMQPQLLATKWGKQVTPENAWREYPRPQLERSDWQNLNGLWDYALLGETAPMPQKYQGKILVPFCIESALSGVKASMKPDDQLWYRRQFDVPANWKNKSVVLNFEAVDWSCTVWVNGGLVGAHKGGYDRFSFDISKFLKAKGPQEIMVAVKDPSSFGTQARGKQQFPQQGIWYTPVSGIWQTVWLEAVSNEAYLQEMKIVPDVDRNSVSIVPLTNKPLEPGYNVKVTVMDGSNTVATQTIAADKRMDIAIASPKLWSPDAPFLYDLKLELTNKDGKTLDEVKSYFGCGK